MLTRLGATIVANALPTIARDLHEDGLRLNLAISCYFLSSAMFVPLSGWLADRFGARRVLIAAILIFASASLLCALSQSLWQLIGARILQGLGGAMMVPVGRLLVLKTAPKSLLVRATAVLTMPALLGPILGPIVGGAIVTLTDWRWIFYINLPIGALGIALVLLFVPEVSESHSQRLDARGFLLVAAGLACVVFGMENAASGALAIGTSVALVVIGSVCLWVYAGHAKHRADAIINLSLFDIPTYRAALLGGVFTRLVLGASPFLLALLLQNVFGLSALTAGLMTFTSAAGALFMKTAAPPIIRHFGFRRVLITNSVTTGGILMCYALLTEITPYAVIVAVLFSAGFVRSLQFTALGAMAFSDVPVSQMSGASSLSSMGQQLSQAMGVSIAAAVLYSMQRADAAPWLTAHQVAPAFIVVGLLSMVSIHFFAQLPDDAGAEVSGYRPTSS
ncbi:MAG: MFS transporter [Oscillatoriales cyanobacterium RU_3_3]|nr:MFS transporter [Oscillatoriales cyanobacterium RU_3_3]